MSQPLKLIKLALNNELYNSHKDLFLDSFFARPTDKIWSAIKYAHEVYKRDLNTAEIFELVCIQNGTLTSAAKEALEQLLVQVDELPHIGTDVALEVIRDAYKHELGRDLIETSYSLIEGKEFDIVKAREIFTGIENNYLPVQAEELDYVPTDVFQMLDSLDKTPKWSFNIDPLQQRVGGLQPGTFTVLFARPECGKSAASIYLACGPGGFCDQGAKTLYICNEELAIRSMLRAVSSFTGMTFDQIKDNPTAASEEFTIRDNIRMIDAGGWSTVQIRNYCAKFEPDVVIVDQLDKMKDYPELEGHMRLRQLYTDTREIGKDYGCAIIGVSQASVEAEGKSVIDYSMLEGSRTGKAAEADLIIGVGVNSIVERNDGTENVRTFNLCKNKLSGNHSSFNVLIQPSICRFKT